MPMDKLAPHQANMAGLAGAPVDAGDEDERRPLKK